MSMKTEQVHIRLSADQRARWEQRAAEDKRTLADWVRIQVDEACDRMDEQDAQKKKK